MEKLGHFEPLSKVKITNPGIENKQSTTYEPLSKVKSLGATSSSYGNTYVPPPCPQWKSMKDINNCVNKLLTTILDREITWCWN